MTDIIITTASSTGWYPRLVSLIGSIHHTNYDRVAAILVHDIGLKPDEHVHIASMDKVRMCPVPMVNPQVLTPLRAREKGPYYTYTGLMTWKPAILKQTMDTYEYALWLDSGITVWGKLDQLWDHVQRAGYWFQGGDNIDWCTTQPVRTRLDVEPHILATNGINAGCFGYSRQISETVIDPCYEWAKDITLFVDDGSAGGGPTSARHEQTLLGILAARAGLLRQPGCDQILYDGRVIRVTCNKEEVDDRTVLYHSRGDCRFNSNKYIRYKPGTDINRTPVWCH